MVPSVSNVDSRAASDAADSARLLDDLNTPLSSGRGMGLG